MSNPTMPILTPRLPTEFLTRGFGRAVLFLMSTMLVVVALACRQSPAPPVSSVGAEAPELRVAAAANLRFAIEEIAQSFEGETGTRVTLVLGSTTVLTQQIEQGAPVDVFFAADDESIARLRERERTVPGTEAVYALGRLILAVNAQAGGEVSSLEELSSPRVRSIAIANPEHAPYGAAGRQALQRAGVWERVRPKLIYGENVAQALQYVQTGNVEVAILPGSYASSPGIRSTPIASDLHDPVRQSTAVIRGSRNERDARVFQSFVIGARGQAILHRHGYESPQPVPLVEEGARGRGDSAPLSTFDFFPLWLSVRVALLATALALPVGVPLAWWLARSSFRGRNVLAALVTLPMLLPPTVLGYYLLLLVGREGPIGGFFESALGLRLVFTWPAAVLAAWVAGLPFLVRTAQAGFEGVDSAYEQAARTLGRTEASVFLSVTIPLAWRAIAAGLALAFARAIGEFGATLMVAGNVPGLTQTMPIAIYDAVQAGRYSQANVLVVLLTLVSIGVLVLLATTTRRA